MRIQGRKNSPVGPAGSAGAPPSAEIGKAPAPAAPAEDSIDISAGSREVGQLKEVIAAMPDVRIEKIEDIRDQVEDGSYHVESEKIAKRVVDEALEEAVRKSGLRAAAAKTV